MSEKLATTGNGSLAEATKVLASLVAPLGCVGQLDGEKWCPQQLLSRPGLVTETIPVTQLGCHCPARIWAPALTLLMTAPFKPMEAHARA